MKRGVPCHDCGRKPRKPPNFLTALICAALEMCEFCGRVPPKAKARARRGRK